MSNGGVWAESPLRHQRGGAGVTAAWGRGEKGEGRGRRNRRDGGRGKEVII